jgi:hypothetical protein
MFFIHTKDKEFHASFESVKKITKTSCDKIFQRKIDKKFFFLCLKAKNFMLQSNPVKKVQKRVEEILSFWLVYCVQKFSAYNFCWVR